MIPPRRIRHPAVPVAIAFGIGVLADRGLDLVLTTWLLLWGTGVLAWFLARRRVPALAVGCLLGSILAFGGARHHAFWSTLADNDISLFAADQPKLVRLAGTLAEPPEIFTPGNPESRAAWASHQTTTVPLFANRLMNNGNWVPISGKASLRISGRLDNVEVGDEVEVFGWLAHPQPASNPGGFDPAYALKRQGIRCVVFADAPGVVTPLRRASEFSVWRWAARWRAKGEALFQRDLSPRTAPVASALLFGIRSSMDEDIREAFRQSGMLHTLAISGVHVAILAALVWGLCRAAKLSLREICVVTALTVIGYTFLTDCRPPVVRATIWICFCLAARIWLRQMAMANGLALAALGVLIWNPSDLFDVGAQLSFLGVLAILCGSGWIRSNDEDFSHGVPPTLLRANGWRRAASRAFLLTRDAWLISVAAALFTMPLVAARFHLVSPIGVVINVFLSPFSTLVLWCGYLHAGFGLLLPQVSWLFAFFFDWGLKSFVWLVEMAARVKMSHASVGGPSDWWLVGYYSILFAIAFVFSAGRWHARHWSVLTAWMVLGLVWGLRSPAPGVLRCTFLSVGHGGATLIETPSGRTLLYDAGAIIDGRIAERAVQSLLWERRYRAIDAIVVSHADVDHFNGVPLLMQEVPVGSLLISQQFLDFGQPAVVALCESSYRSCVPIRLIRDGDRLKLDDAVKITVMHPPPGIPHSDDNSNSVTLLVEYGGRRLLLTGDLEGKGQDSLLETASQPIDVLQAPHHGSRKANNVRLAEWANPQNVVVSAGRRVDWKNLTSVYSPAEIFSTYLGGAVTFEIRSDGTLTKTVQKALTFNR